MPNTLYNTTQARPALALAGDDEAPARTALRANLETLLAEARPRLLRLARSYGIAPEDADDIAQETLVAAWQELAYLREPQRFDAWLDGICRNLARSRTRAASRSRGREAPLPGVFAADDYTSEQAEAPELADPDSLDLTEELCRQDLERLLDRALSYMPQSARQALTLHYLEDVPQREAALRLGLTVSALEARLHRARRQLRQVLSSDLRAEAEAFGLMLDPPLAEGWRESREWCMFCGSHRLHGAFELMPDGEVALRMRCPECSRRYGTFINGGGITNQTVLHSFRPALKRLYQDATRYFSAALRDGGRQTCIDCCQAPARITVTHPDEVTLPIAYPPLYMLISQCPRCGPGFSMVMAAVIVHPEVQQFIARHPRWIVEPDCLASYAGQLAIHHRLVDVSSASRLNVFVSPETLQVLGLIEA
jgi:RNA polymerase sigma-70 factor (ECF subfamily)